jgi:hypothetical protein
MITTLTIRAPEMNCLDSALTWVLMVNVNFKKKKRGKILSSQVEKRGNSLYSQLAKREKYSMFSGWYQ